MLPPKQTTQDLGLAVAVIEGITPPSNTKVLWYNLNDNLHYYYNVVTSKWEKLVRDVGGVGQTSRQITVSLTNGKTWGTIKDGDVINSGTPYQDLFERALIESKYPTYSPATLGLSVNALLEGEVGESFTVKATATFSQNDAGPLSLLRIRRDGTSVGSDGTSNTLERTETLVRSLAGTTYQAVANYVAGLVKNVSPGNTPDTRPPAVRTSTAPQAAETNFQSNTITLRGLYRLYFGSTSQTPIDRASAIALGNSPLTNEGNIFILNTGTVNKKFVILLPPGKNLISVLDLDNLGVNITTSYVLVGSVKIATADGTLPDYNLFQLSTSVAYPNSARHQFTIG